MKKVIKKIRAIKPGSKQDIALSNLPGVKSSNKILKVQSDRKIKQNLTNAGVDAVKLGDYY